MLLEHGGRLNAAAARYRIDRADWLDLSTGINPDGWPVPALPAEVWQRLPEDDDALPAAVEAHYGRPGLPVAGSQAALATLPRLRAACPHCTRVCGWMRSARWWACWNWAPAPAT